MLVETIIAMILVILSRQRSRQELRDSPVVSLMNYKERRYSI